ncbi:MAG: hypothetical protein AAB362_01825 [Patescibacteria group bacterium]
MGLFGDSKPHVGSEEYKLVRGHLHSEGFSQQELADVDMIFLGDLEKKSGSYHRGIDEKELQEKIKWLRAHPNSHRLESSKIDKLEESLKKKM